MGEPLMPSDPTVWGGEGSAPPGHTIAAEGEEPPLTKPQVSTLEPSLACWETVVLKRPSTSGLCWKHMEAHSYWTLEDDPKNDP